jgi:hypothetical protein
LKGGEFVAKAKAKVTVEVVLTEGEWSKVKTALEDYGRQPVGTAEEYNRWNDAFDVVEAVEKSISDSKRGVAH